MLPSFALTFTVAIPVLPVTVRAIRVLATFRILVTLRVLVAVAVSRGLSVTSGATIKFTSTYVMTSTSTSFTFRSTTLLASFINIFLKHNMYKQNTKIRYKWIVPIFVTFNSDNFSRMVINPRWSFPPKWSANRLSLSWIPRYAEHTSQTRNFCCWYDDAGIEFRYSCSAKAFFLRNSSICKIKLTDINIHYCVFCHCEHFDRKIDCNWNFALLVIIVIGLFL